MWQEGGNEGKIEMNVRMLSREKGKAMSCAENKTHQGRLCGADELQVRDFQTVDFETKSDVEHYRTALNG
ncbi:hypothetical protein EYF80_010537 [Liparis tanakae]|uniref:Uncharacterized protein n=1 Tax=Liparis tanakae TaxID=230148 RepID=A0A4Z2IQ03_9TELE|nr:hypothetical protein EYF80_010537 [Liparis tanakae]